MKIMIASGYANGYVSYEVRIMNCGIYQITNKLNGNYYIGSSNDFKVRWKTHRNKLNASKHHCIHLQRAWNKYGEQSFEFKGLTELPNDKDLLLKEEQVFLDQHYGQQYFYNGHAVARGGALPGALNHMYGKTHTEEVRRFLSEINTGERYPHLAYKDEHMKKMWSKVTTRFHGRTHSEETKKKMSKARTGKKHKAETKVKISEAQKGKVNKGREKQKKPITVCGVLYDSFTSAGKAEGVPGNTIKYRVYSDRFPDYQLYQEGVETIESTS